MSVRSIPMGVSLGLTWVSGSFCGGQLMGSEKQRLGRQVTDQEFEQLRDRLAQGGGRETVGGNSGDQSAIFDWVKQATTAFWDAYLKDDGQARAWLNSDALASVSKGMLRLERR